MGILLTLAVILLISGYAAITHYRLYREEERKNHK